MPVLHHVELFFEGGADTFFCFEDVFLFLFHGQRVFFSMVSVFFLCLEVFFYLVLFHGERVFFSMMMMMRRMIFRNLFSVRECVCTTPEQSRQNKNTHSTIGKQNH